MRRNFYGSRAEEESYDKGYGDGRSGRQDHFRNEHFGNSADKAYFEGLRQAEQEREERRRMYEEERRREEQEEYRRREQIARWQQEEEQRYWEQIEQDRMREQEQQYQEPPYEEPPAQESFNSSNDDLPF